MKANQTSPGVLTQSPGRAALGSRITVEDFSEADKAPREKKLNVNAETDPGGGMGNTLYPFPTTVFFW